MNLIKDYIEYIKDNPEGYWFKRKLYGFGWTPARPAGWLAVLAYLSVVLFLVIQGELNNSIEESPTTFIFMLVSITALFLAVCWKKGEPLKWQWGRKEEVDKK